MSPGHPACPPQDCQRCPRLAAFRSDNRTRYPNYHNAPVDSFGPEEAALLIVGLAPGLHGANQTGRPFTGDYAGDLLYPTLLGQGFAAGSYGRRADDGLQLVECRITNAVRCVPPENKPIGQETTACRPFLRDELEALACLQVILALGRVAHDQVLAALGERRASFPFAHGAFHRLSNQRVLVDSYHCSRYNVNTGRLTAQMFQDVLQSVRAELKNMKSFTEEPTG